jgi:hypothetical protein
MTKDEALRLALEALEREEYRLRQTGQSQVYSGIGFAITAIKAALEAKDESWTPDDTAYRPNGLPQDFIKHEVESPEDWSEWVCPNPDEYFMKCCDCGLVHEVQYRVARYGEGDYCELVDDKDVQAQFRMRRRTPPQRKPLTDEEIKSQWSVFWEADCHPWAIDFARAIEAKLNQKNFKE